MIRVLCPFAYASISFGLLVGVPSSSAEPLPLSPEALASAGILVWEYEIPEGLRDGELDQFEWILTNSDLENKSFETGLAFKKIAQGTEVRIFLWIGEFFTVRSPLHQPDGIRYSLSYREAGGKMQNRFGIMKIPEGFDELFGYAKGGSSLNSERGSLLMLMKSGTKGESMAMLHLVGEFEDRKEPSQGR